jgi:predicted Zn-dependent peptidase
VSSNSSVQGIANSLARYNVLYGDTDLINKQLEIIRSISREDIRAVAQKYLNAESRVELKYIPKQNTEE